MATDRPAPAADPAPTARLWLWMTLALVTGAVLWTSWPIFELPQLEPDDYRYLALVQALREGTGQGLVEACVVENRWDHLWWVDTTSVVRFFRPTVLLSYLADDLVHGGSATGLLATNLLLHLACSLLVTLVLWAWIPSVLGAALASLLCACFACKAETIWYVSGRTDTLAALGFLSALWLHGRGGVARWWALPCFAFAIVSKELTAALPLLLVLHDAWITRRRAGVGEALRADWRLWASYAVVALVFFAVRRLALGSAVGSQLVYPYFVAPSHPAFAAHLWNQLRNYAENLLLGRITPPFMRPEQVADYTTAGGLVLAITMLAIALALLFRERRFWLLVLLGILTWLPTSFVYVSERYLYLPSLAVAGTLGLLVARASRLAPAAAWPRTAAVAALTAAGLAWTALQSGLLGPVIDLGPTAGLREKNLRISFLPREALAMREQLVPLREAMARTGRLLFVDFPGDVVHAQFLEAQLRVDLGLPRLECRILTTGQHEIDPPRTLRVTRKGPQALELVASPLLMRHGEMPWPWRSLATESSVASERLGFRVEVADGERTLCRRLRVELPRPVDDYTVVRFVPAAGTAGFPKGPRIRAGGIEVLRP